MSLSRPNFQPAMIISGGRGLLVSSAKLSSAAAFPPVTVFCFCLGSGFTSFMFLSVFIKKLIFVIIKKTFQPAMIKNGGLGLLVSSAELSAAAAFPPVIVFNFCPVSGFTFFMFLSVFIKIELRCEISVSQ
jgi:hypothetical protein